MLPTLEEMSAWSIEETKAEILAFLPVGWTFDACVVSDLLTGTIRNDMGVVVWEQYNPDPKLLMFDAYGWLYAREVQSTDPVWNRRQELHPALVGHHARVMSARDPDPDDLVPSEVEAMRVGRSGV